MYFNELAMYLKRIWTTEPLEKNISQGFLAKFAMYLKKMFAQKVCTPINEK